MFFSPPSNLLPTLPILVFAQPSTSKVYNVALTPISLQLAYVTPPINVGEIEASCFLKKNTLNPKIVIYFGLGERKRNFVYLYKILKEDL